MSRDSSALISLGIWATSPFFYAEAVERPTSPSASFVGATNSLDLPFRREPLAGMVNLWYGAYGVAFGVDEAGADGYEEDFRHFFPVALKESSRLRALGSELSRLRGEAMEEFSRWLAV